MMPLFAPLVLSALAKGAKMPTANGTPKTQEAHDKTAAGEARGENRKPEAIAVDKHHVAQARRESEAGGNGH